MPNVFKLILVLAIALAVDLTPVMPCRAAEQSSVDWEKYVVAAPEVVYPAVLARTGKQGSGTFRLTINPKNGEVTEVKVVRSVGDRLVIGIYVMNFFQWRFRPGTLSSATISRGVDIIGRSRNIHR